jgi:methanogenic corrinoid protein MtbC1
MIASASNVEGQGVRLGKPDKQIDSDVFARTASLFAAKKRVLGDDALEMLAGDILRHVALRSRRPPSSGAPLVSDDNLAMFCGLLLQPEPTAALHFIQARRAEGLTHEAICLGYFGAAAMRLGEAWDNSRLSFLEVTVGVGHLYGLIRAMRAHWPTAGATKDERRWAMFATVPGEDHGLGITIAAEMFRVEGWDIDLRTGQDHDSLVAFVERMCPPIVGLSFSSERCLPALVRLVVALRIVSPTAIIGVAPPSTMEAMTVSDLVDIDLVFRDAGSARSDLERLVRLRD